MRDRGTGGTRKDIAAYNGDFGESIELEADFSDLYRNIYNVILWYINY